MNLINQLLQLLEQEYGLYSRLLSALEGESDALKMWDMDRMADKAREKEAISADMGRIGESMRSLITGLAEESGRSPSEMNITGIASAHPAVGRRLLDIREKILLISVKTAELNNFNRTLIGNAVGITKKCLRHMGSLTGGTPDTYAPGHVIEGRMRPGLVMSRTF